MCAIALSEIVPFCFWCSDDYVTDLCIDEEASGKVRKMLYILKYVSAYAIFWIY